MLLSKKFRGSALLTALFIMTLVAIVATAMTTKLQLDIYRTRLIVTHDKLYLASQAVTFWALSELSDNKKKFTRLGAQGMIDQFPKNMETLVNQVHISGGLYDLQARFNLNNLTDNKLMASFTYLINNALPQLNATDSNNLALAIKDWLNPYDLARGKDLYTDYYQSQKPPYFPSHQVLQSSSELRLIKDISPQIYQGLEPYITVLPEATTININTASKQVIRSLGNGVSEEHANELIMARGENGITKLQDINELLQKLNIPSAQITIESTYFLNVAYASSDEFNLVVYSLLKRTKDKQGKLSVSIIRQSINSF